jgi:hypothetical protein
MDARTAVLGPAKECDAVSLGEQFPTFRDCLALEDEGTVILRTVGVIHLTAQRHIPEDLSSYILLLSLSLGPLK